MVFGYTLGIVPHLCVSIALTSMLMQMNNTVFIGFALKLALDTLTYVDCCFRYCVSLTFFKIQSFLEIQSMLYGEE